MNNLLSKDISLMNDAARKSGATEMLLFGSFWNEDSEPNDIDIAYYYPKGVPGSSPFSRLNLNTAIGRQSMHSYRGPRTSEKIDFDVLLLDKKSKGDFLLAYSNKQKSSLGKRIHPKTVCLHDRI